MDPRTFLTALAAKCPAYREHLPDCPLRAIRPEDAPPSAQGAARALDDGAVDDLVRRHFLCLCRKDGCGVD